MQCRGAQCKLQGQENRFTWERAWRWARPFGAAIGCACVIDEHGLAKLSASVTGAVKARSNACGEHCAIDDAVIAGLPWRPRRAH
jgi:hypothetical protein